MNILVFWDCLFGYCCLCADQAILIIILVGIGLGGFFLGLIIGLAGKSGKGGGRDIIREIHYKDSNAPPKQ